MRLSFLMSIRTWSLIAVLAMTVVRADAAEQSTTSEVLRKGIDFGDWSKTRNLCDQILRKDPNNADALVARACLESFVGKYDDAISDCNKVLATRPQFALALVTRGAILCNIGNPQAGHRDLKSYLALTQAVHDPITRNHRANAFDYLKDYKAAKRECQDIINDTGSATLDEVLFRRALAQGRLNKNKEAIETLTRLVRKYPASPLLASHLAYYHSENGDSVLALKEYAAVAEQAPGCYFIQGCWGWTLEKAKKFDEAIHHYNRSLQTDDRYLFGLRHRGRCYCIQGENSQALEDFSRAIIIDPDDTYSILRRVSVYHNLSQYKEAIDDCNRVIAIDPKNVEAWCQLGHCQAHLQKWNEAYAASNRAVKLSPSYTDALYYRGWAENEMGHKGEALADFSAVIRIDPKYESAYDFRGILLRDKKQYAQSIIDLSEAIKINPKNALYFCARGCAEVRNCNYQQSVEDCTKSLQLDPNRTHPNLSRGEAYSALGKYDLALSDLNRYIKSDAASIEALTERAKVYQKLNKSDLANLDLAKLGKLKLTVQTGSHHHHSD